MAEHAGLATAVVQRGFGSTVVLHDDTSTGHSLVDTFITPILADAGVTVLKVPVPVDTVDAAGVVAPATVAEADSWIVVTGTATCQPVIVSRSASGVTPATFYSSSCTTDATLSAVGTMMDNSFFIRISERETSSTKASTSRARRQRTSSKRSERRRGTSTTSS